MDDLVDSYNSVISHASKAVTKWNEQVEKFKVLGIDLEKVWENLNGATASTDNSEPVGSTGAVEPTLEQSAGSLLTIDL